MSPLSAASRLEAGYAVGPGWDEMLDETGAVRRHWRRFSEIWGGLGPEGRSRLVEQSQRGLEEAGVSFDPHADGARGAIARPFDPAPVLISASEWRLLSEAVEQRARLIELVLRDLLGPAALLSTGALPPAVAYGGPNRIVEAEGWDRPPRRRLFRYAVDVARAADGGWVVLDDHVDAPSGEGLALALRVALAQAAPELFEEVGARRLAGHFSTLRATLEEETGVEGRIAILGAGPSDRTHFSQTYLARFLALTMVEPGDLAVRDDEAHVKTLEGLRRVDVLLRATPSAGVDPLYAHGASAAGAPGLLRSARLGRLIIANALGAGLLDGRALAPFADRLARDLLGEPLKLPGAPTLWLGEPDARADYAAAPEAWRLTPLNAADSTAETRALETAEPAAREAALAREGWRFCARAETPLATAPSLVGGALAARPWTLRLFAAASADGYSAMPGGLAFVSAEASADRAPAEGAVKDVWVASESRVAEPPGAGALLNRRRRTAHLRRTGRDLLSRVADNLFWLGRNAERAESKLRVLKIVVERMIDASRTDRDPELLHRVLALATEEGSDEPTFAAVRERAAALALGGETPGGVPRLLDAVYWNAAATRAHLSRDAWRDVSALAAAPVWRRKPDPGRLLSLAGPVDDAIRSLAAFAGASHENMTRNYAWRFLELGRRIERAARTAAMFRALAAQGGANESAACYALLQLCDSFFAYRARYLVTPEATPAIDLLILDETNPRSLAFQLARMEETLDALPRQTPYRNPEHRLTLSLLTELRVSDAETLGATDEEGARAALIALAEHVETDLDRVSSHVAAAWFAHAEPAMRTVMSARRGEP